MHYSVGDLVKISIGDSLELGVVISKQRENSDAYCFSEHAKTLSALRAFVYYVLVSKTNKIVGPLSSYSLSEPE